MEPYPTPNLVRQNILDLLDNISFVDKVIFGKLNYNYHVSNHKNNETKEFYNKCSQEVIDFCKARNIEYHIKYGTRVKDNNKTVKIFEKGIKKEIVVVNDFSKDESNSVKASSPSPRHTISTAGYSITLGKNVA